MVGTEKGVTAKAELVMSAGAAAVTATRAPAAGILTRVAAELVMRAASWEAAEAVTGAVGATVEMTVGARERVAAGKMAGVVTWGAAEAAAVTAVGVTTEV